METKALGDFRDKAGKKDADIETLSELIMDSEEVRTAALENLTQKNETVRYNSYRALKRITESRPELLYPFWNLFMEQLESDNTYHILVGIHILADLTAIAPEDRFGEIFDRYYGLLGHRSMMVVSHVCLASGRLMRYNPGLVSRIEDKLLNIDRFIGKQKHKELIRGAALEAFMEAREASLRKEEIREFAGSLLHASDSPKSRRLAKKFFEETGD